MYKRQTPKPLQEKKKNVRRYSGCLRRLYKQLRKKEKQSQGVKEKINLSECSMLENSKER